VQGAFEYFGTHAYMCCRIELGYNCVCACVVTCEVKRVRDTMVKQACACHVYHLDQSYWLISGFVQAFHSDFGSAFWPLIYVYYLHNKASQIVHVKTQG